MKNVIQGTTLSGTGAVTIAPGAEITIRNPAGQLVPLWADRAGTQPHDNPFLTDSEGNFRVYADSGWVHVRAQKDGSVHEWRYVPIGSAAAMDIGEVYEALGAEVYSSVSEGLSNSAEGDFFLVESSGSLDLYRVVNGVAEQWAAGIDADALLATRAYADGVAAEAESNATNAAAAAASAAYQQATEYSDSQLQAHRESDDHDGRYYTKTEVDQALSTKVDDDDPRLSDAREWIAPMVTPAEVEDGVSTEPRKWSVEMVKLAAETYGGIGSEIIGPGPDQVPTNGMLGTAATRDVTTSPTDTTAGRVMKVGDGGILARPSGEGSFNFDDPDQPNQIAQFIISNATGLTPPGIIGATVLRQAYRSGVGKRWYSDLVIANADRDGRVFSRAVGHDGTQITEDTGWREHYHTGNPPPMIGVGQTWQLVTSSRTAGTTYTNTTGRPIMVAISFAGYEGYTFLVDGVEVANDAQGHTVWAIVPSGSTYRLIAPGVIYCWSELR